MVRDGRRASVATWLGAVLLLGGALGGCRRPTGCPEGTRPIPGKASARGIWCEAADGGRTYWIELHAGTKQPHQVCPFLNGRADGPYEARHLGGKVALSGAYAHGRRQGVWRQLDDTGRKVAEGQYRDGQLVRGVPVGMAATCETVTP
jgi:hypothetical protein